jgi:hypothetical protein
MLDSDFSHTHGAPGTTDDNTDLIPWWKVDFGDPKSIQSGQIWGRTECCQFRLDGFQIWVGNSGTAYDAPGNSNCFTATSNQHHRRPFTHSFSCFAFARYLFVVLISGECVTMREIEIYPSGQDPLGMIFL